MAPPSPARARAITTPAVTRAAPPAINFSAGMFLLKMAVAVAAISTTARLTTTTLELYIIAYLISKDRPEMIGSTSI
jgi:hypothetical protein